MNQQEIVKSIDAVKSIDVNTHFKTIFTTITGLTILFVLLYAILCFLIDSPNEMQNNFASLLETLIQSGFSVLCGLIAGKAL